MDEKIEKWFYDIKIAIEEIEFFTKTISEPNSIKYKNNLILKRAVEREFEIIGEAMNRIIKYDSQFLEKIPESRSIIDLRNHIIHSYDNISDEIIWSILVNHIPKLKNQILNLLN